MCCCTLSTDLGGVGVFKSLNLFKKALNLKIYLTSYYYEIVRANRLVAAHTEKHNFNSYNKCNLYICSCCFVVVWSKFSCNIMYSNSLVVVFQASWGWILLCLSGDDDIVVKSCMLCLFDKRSKSSSHKAQNLKSTQDWFCGRALLELKPIAKSAGRSQWRLPEKISK